MFVNEQYQDLPLVQYESVLRILPDGTRKTCEQAVISEHVMDVYINEVLTMKLVCIPRDLACLAIGRLITEGIIREPGEVETVYICEHGAYAKIFLKDREAGTGEESSGYVELTPSCCTGNRVINGAFMGEGALEPVTAIPWELDWIQTLAEHFQQDTPLHRLTRATHSCYLMQDGDILFECEDIGRHNALDKCVGYAALHGIDPGSCIVYSTGRIPIDMAVKVVRAGIPVLVSKEHPTAEAAALAKQYKVTLLGAGKRGDIQIYT